MSTFARGICVASFLTLLTSSGLAIDLPEPITLASENGLLDLLMIAKPGPINTLAAYAPGGAAPTGWVYEICKRPTDGSQTCPANASANYYGGTLLQLQKGDTLKIRLINELPFALDSKHASEDGRAFLTQNPTNIHTHGMLVSPNGPSATDPTYGDNIFVLTFNSANGTPEASPHMHSTIRLDFTDYKIKIPANHPSGLFWFHPHAHGVALNQISAGLGGIITVGNPSDYVCRDRPCAGFLPTISMRHIILKDTQILPTGKLMDQEDPSFCPPAIAPGEGPRKGSCLGSGGSGDGTVDYTNGKWFFTLNGQVNPSMPVSSGGGEVWRIANVSGSVTYNLNLWNQQQGRQMMMQVLSIDGVSVKPNAGMSSGHLMEIGGSKFTPEACPGVGPIAATLLEQPICTRVLHMMPSSRVEVWVIYRDKNDIIAPPPTGAAAIFRTDGYTTGPSGDSWPAIDLGSVQFPASSQYKPPVALSVNGEAAVLRTPASLANDMAPSNSLVQPDASCKVLPPGHMRRIFYGVPTGNLSAFGLAYEELDEHGKVVGTPATDLIPFDPMYPTVCVPLGPNNTPATERWQLINVATEDHNFHIHQVKFRLLGKDELTGSVVPNQGPDSGILMDNVPLPHSNGTCGVNPPDDLSNPITDFRAGLCQTSPVTVEIPFAVAGDFVYHCHILEHEDGGMMARIRVRPTK